MARPRLGIYSKPHPRCPHCRQHLPLLLQGLACIRLRPHPAWMVSYSRLVRQHLYTYGPAQLAQLVWSYGQLTPAPPYARLYFRPPKQLVRELLRLVKAWGLTDRSVKCPLVMSSVSYSQ